MNTPIPPLAPLLSQVLVAFTIEFDNEAERRMPHRTTTLGPAASGDGLWLVSMVMWLNVMQYLGPDNLTAGELVKLARTRKLNLPGMRRWGYIVVDPTNSRPNPPRRDWLIRATAKGQRAQQVWRPLTGEIEDRWK